MERGERRPPLGEPDGRIEAEARVDAAEAEQREAAIADEAQAVAREQADEVLGREVVEVWADEPLLPDPIERVASSAARTVTRDDLNINPDDTGTFIITLPPARGRV